jgi:acyl-coenzyme A synthetase/AMP-(fatty) acid ligase
MSIESEFIQGVSCESFWRGLRSFGDKIAIVDSDAGVCWTYAQLAAAVDQMAERLRTRERAVILLFASNDVASIICYLAALEARQPVFLSPVPIDHPGAAVLIDRYRPELVLFRSGTPEQAILDPYERLPPVNAYHILARRERGGPVPHEDLALVLSTSASTGSPKGVRLSYRSLQKGAATVGEALGLSPHERCLLSLPFSYVYGLSVVNSTLHAGASLVVVTGTAADATYWERIARMEVTAIAAVSQTFAFMRTLGMDAQALPSLRKLTHSGDALQPELFTWVFQHFGTHGVAIYLMYGQTEAGGRMTVLPPSSLPTHSRSVGIPVGTSAVSIAPDGEIIFRGPAVMLGYAQSREDLICGDTQDGELRTGDTGYIDALGLLHISGRLSRFCKVYGQRIGLDEVERVFDRTARVAAIEKESIISVFVEGSTLDPVATRLELARRFRVPPQSFRIVQISQLPRTERGKISYASLLKHS